MPEDLVKGQLEIVGKPLKITPIGKLGPRRAEFILTGGKQKTVKEKLPPGSPPPKVVKRIKDGIKKSQAINSY